MKPGPKRITFLAKNHCRKTENCWEAPLS